MESKHHVSEDKGTSLVFNRLCISINVYHLAEPSKEPNYTIILAKGSGGGGVGFLKQRRSRLSWNRSNVFEQEEAVKGAWDVEGLNSHVDILRKHERTCTQNDTSGITKIRR